MSNENNLPWYARAGKEQDVVLFSRVRLARNLANFPFPMYFRNDDGQRVQSLVFDAFARMQNDDQKLSFHAVETKELDENGRKILEERGVLKKNQKKDGTFPETGVVMSMEGSVSTLINCGDHLRIASFSSGLDIQKNYSSASELDWKLQQYLQFAASYDFGYLTAALRDAGSGMKLSAKVHIPATIRTGKLNIIVDYLREKGFGIMPAYPDISQGAAAGSIYRIKTESSMEGSELDQIADFEAACKFIAESERKISTTYADNKRTVVYNSVIRAYSVAKLSLLVSLRESVDIISDLMLGLRLGFVSGIDQKLLCGLLYRVQPAHLYYLLKDGNLAFEKDIQDDTRAKIDRLRALVLQEAVQKISLGKL